MAKKDLKELYASRDLSTIDFTQRHDAFADAVISLLGDLPGRRILDLGCGSATLAVELAERGFEATGLDWQLEAARHRIAARKVGVRLVEQDMAEMAFHEEFDAVVNWDISGIGLFPTDEANVDIVSRVYGALVHGGQFLIETYNLPYARAHGIENLTYDPRSGRCVGKAVRTMPDGRQRIWELSVRFYSVEEWHDIFSRIGFEFLGAWGSMAKAPLSDESRVLVILGRK